MSESNVGAQTLGRTRSQLLKERRDRLHADSEKTRASLESLAKVGVSWADRQDITQSRPEWFVTCEGDATYKIHKHKDLRDTRSLSMVGTGCFGGTPRKHKNVGVPSHTRSEYLDKWKTMDIEKVYAGMDEKEKRMHAKRDVLYGRGSPIVHALPKHEDGRSRLKMLKSRKKLFLKEASSVVPQTNEPRPVPPLLLPSHLALTTHNSQLTTHSCVLPPFTHHSKADTTHSLLRSHDCAFSLCTI